MYEKLPQMLKERYRFCLWKYESRGGKRTKVPYTINGRRADTGNQSCFTDYRKAAELRSGYDGIGVGVFDDLAAIDIDDCVSNGVLSELARDIVETIDSYTELSPSGRGVRILCRASGVTYDTKRFFINNRSLHLEIYVAGVTTKFVTITGDCIRLRGLEERSAQLMTVLETYMTRPQAERSKQTGTVPGSCLSDDEVLGKAMASRQGPKFNRLWNGDTTGYPSHSEADLALLTILAFWCGGDRDQMDRLFAQSGLMREKWNRGDYREHSLELAISGTSEFFKPLRVDTAQEDFESNKWVSTLEDLDAIHNPRYSDQDIGAGRLFADVFRDKARFIPERKKWAVYDGKRWVIDIAGLLITEPGKDLSDALMLYVTTLHSEKDREILLKWCRKWVQRRYRDIYIKEAQSVYQLPASQLDQDPYLFNCNNCTIDLRSRTVYAHRAEDFITKISPADYDPTAVSARWTAFIDEIMSANADKADFLQRALAYGLSGDTRYECMFILYGETTRNGKGTLMESVLRVMGDYGITVRPETIAQKRNANSHSPSEDVARLVGVRFANISEPSRGLVLDAAQVKSMTGNDTLNARYLNENSFDFSPQFKLYINTNYLPVVSDMTLFTGGRIVIIPFDRHFEEGEQDRSLKTTFSESETQSAILNWLLDGCEQLQKHGMTQPTSVREATAAYYHDSDKTHQFADDMLIADVNAEERTSAVYDAYRQWCMSNGCCVENSRNFNAELRKFANVVRKRPQKGGEKTTLLMGYRLRSDFLTE